MGYDYRAIALTSKAAALMPLTPGENAPLYTKKSTGFIKDSMPHGSQNYKLRIRLAVLNFTKEAAGCYFPFQVLFSLSSVIFPFKCYFPFQY
jgi:hypothetical protein